MSSGPLYVIGAIVVALGSLFFLKGAAVGGSGPQEPFQVGAQTESALAASLLTPEKERDELRKKITEIQANYNAIESAKNIQEVALYRALDPENINTLEYIIEEISFFGKPSEDFNAVMKNLDNYVTLSEDTRAAIRLMIYSAYQQSQILTYMFSTLPTMVVSSNLIVDTNAADKNSIADPRVLEMVKQNMLNFLSNLPNPMTEYRRAEDQLMMTANSITGDAVKDMQKVEPLMQALEKYKRITNIQAAIYNKAIFRAKLNRDAAVNYAGVNYGQPPGTGFTEAGIDTRNTTIQIAMKDLQDAYDKTNTFLDKAIDNMKEVQAKIKGLVQINPNDTNIETLNKNVASMLDSYGKMRMAATEAQTPLLPEVPKTTVTEGFQSKGNPYNMPSPSAQQAYEFRLGKRQIVDAVMQHAS